ncbi:MAG: hypothetical protein ACPHK8_02905 [Thermoplasmatota archaeon]
MRALVTGVTNPTGQAIVKELAANGFQVRAFGTTEDFGDNVKSFPGWVDTAGSIEPVLAEREAVIHASCLDSVKDKAKLAVRIERGTRYTVFGAEREQVQHFVYVRPEINKVNEQVMHQADAHVAGIRGDINVKTINAMGPEATAKAVLHALQELPVKSNIVGGNDNAVTA